MNTTTHIVADDWTRNWQADISIKITAIVIWVVTLIGFSATVILVNRQEANLRTEFTHEADSLSHTASQLLKNSTSPSYLKTHFQRDLQQTLFTAIQLNIDDHPVIIGTIPDNAETVERTISIENKSNKIFPSSVRLIAYHPSIRSLVISQRGELLIGLVIGLLCFGVFLSLVIKQVLSIPLHALIDATQAVSSGNLNMRINVTRQDDFGKLSRFFNQMLDTIVQQQQTLRTTNDELRKEVLVRSSAERELLAHRDSLEQIVETRTNDLARAKDDAERANEAKTNFLSRMSHELRTPLNAIIGFSELLVSDPHHNLSAEHADNAEEILRAGHHLLDLINEVLDLARVESGRLDLQPESVAIAPIINDCAKLIRPLADKNRITVSTETDSDCKVIADRMRLRQILLNLLSNAVKYNRFAGSVRITCGPSDNGLVRIAVRDNGRGIDADALPRLFQPFERLGSIYDGIEGTGIGLALSKRMADAMEGSIGVESTPGVGSIFWVELPGTVNASSTMTVTDHVKATGT